MSLCAVVLQLASQESPPPGRCRIGFYIVLTLYGLLLLASLWLASKDASLHHRGRAGLWIMALGILAPEVNICLHGVMGSLAGMPFSAGTPLMV
jgi:hypothetical protein